MKKLLYLLLLVPLWVQGQDCKGMKEIKDEFTGDVSYESPIGKEFAFTYVATTGKIYVFMRTYAPGAARGEGAILLFENGDKISYDQAKVNIRYGDYDMATCTITISADDLQKLATVPLKAYRLYVYDHKIKSPEKIQAYAGCIASKLKTDAN